MSLPIYYSESQKALMWDRWRKGETIHQIAKLFDRGKRLSWAVCPRSCV